MPHQIVIIVAQMITCLKHQVLLHVQSHKLSTQQQKVVNDKYRGWFIQKKG